MAAPRRDQKLPNYKYMLVKGKRVDIIPIFYWGKNQGHGNYMAGRRSDNRKLLCDYQNVPYTYSQITLSNWVN